MNGEIEPGASQIHGIYKHTEYKKCEVTGRDELVMRLHNKLKWFVDAEPVKYAMEKFFKFIEESSKDVSRVILVAHNGSGFEGPILKNV